MSRADLQEALQAALKIEHATIPPYMCALDSIHPDTNAGACAPLRRVLMEEMLHMILMANLIITVIVFGV